MSYICGAGSTKTLNMIFDEYASLISSTLDEYASAISKLIEPFQSLFDAIDELNALCDIPLLQTKKQLKYKQPVYRMNYIQPQIRRSKYLPYQRRIY